MCSRAPYDTSKPTSTSPDSNYPAEAPGCPAWRLATGRWSTVTGDLGRSFVVQIKPYASDQRAAVLELSVRAWAPAPVFQ